MSSSKITTLIHKRLLTIYLYFFLVSIAAAFSLSAQATSAFPISFPQLDSPFEGVALTDALFANYLYEKPKKNWAAPYMFLPRRDDRFFVYPVTQRNVNEDENKAVSSNQPEGASAPDQCEDVPASALAHDGFESAPEIISVHDKSKDELQGATAIDNSVYRSWLLERVQQISPDFFRTNILEVDPSLIDDQLLTEITISNFHKLPNDAIQIFLGKYLKSLTSEQLTEWFNHLLQSPPKIFQAFSQSLPDSLIEAGLPPLPQEMLDALRENEFFSDFVIKALLLMFAFLHEQERGISMEENEYYQQLALGYLPRQQPPQRSFILTLTDFQHPVTLIRMSRPQAFLLTTAAHTHRAFRQLATPEQCYQTYLQTLLRTFLSAPDELIAHAKALYSRAIHSQHPLRDEYGLFYVPSERWLSPVVEAIRQQAGENPAGLEIAAGSGSLSYFLSSHYNIPMTATDNFSGYQEITRKTNDNLRADVIRTDALTAVRNHPETNFLVLSWPDLYMNTETSQNIETIISNLRGRNDPFYQVVKGHVQKYYPFLAAILEWNDRGPILFIGELRAGSFTGSEHLRAYLQRHFDAISFKDFYQPLPFTSDYPTLFVPKKKRQPDKAADKGKDKD